MRAFLKRTLAQALYLDEAAIDDDRPFVDLGLDSIVGVEWVKSINQSLGLDVGATRVYDYSTIAALAAFLEDQSPAAPRSADPVPAPTAATSPPAGVDALMPALRLSLAQALYLDEASVDEDRAFVDLGLDSIVGVEWVRTINRTFGL